MPTKDTPPHHISATATTTEILSELGHRIRRYRLQQNRTVAEIASRSGLSRFAIESAEHGRNPTLDTLVRILRALGRVEALDAFLPAPLISPLELAELSGKQRQRAGTVRRRKMNKKDPNA
ncbi:MAG: helix-turn-helix transcriptional regulator [Gemmatimonadaceae bacterium]